MTDPVLEHPIRLLPHGEDAEGLDDVAVRVVPMSFALASQWHAQVQPLIDANFVHAAQFSAGGAKRIRADVGWDWPKQWLLAGLHTRLMGAVHGPALALCIVVDTEDAQVFPIGMLTAVPLLVCTAFGEKRRRGFGWFLSDAPRQAFAHWLGQSPVKMLAPALLDCAIQTALDRGEDGTFLLHADPNGGQHLVDFYANKIRMRQLPAGAAPVTLLRGLDASSQYFHFDRLQAEAYCMDFDVRR